MLYKIVYDKNTRLRVRAGKYAFTKEEGYGLSELLCEYDFIDEVTTSHKNGSILIKYNDIKKRNDILLILKSITKNDLMEGKPSDKEVLKTLANKFFIKLSKKILKRYLLKVVIPIPLRRLRILYKSVPFIIDGMIVFLILGQMLTFLMQVHFLVPCIKEILILQIQGCFYYLFLIF